MDRDVHVALILTGLIPLTELVVRGGAVGTGATLGLLMVGGGLVGLVRGARRKGPAARLIDRSSSCRDPR